MRRDDVELIESEPLHDGFFKLSRERFRHRRFDGGWSAPVDREMLHVGTSVLALPYDPIRDAVVLIEQFRIGAYAAGREACWLTEVVAGLGEPGEDPAVTACRETMEETGMALRAPVLARRWLSSPGVLDENVVMYVGQVDAQPTDRTQGLASEHEDIRVLVVPADEAIGFLDTSRVDNAHTLVALSWFARHRDRLRRLWS